MSDTSPEPNAPAETVSVTLDLPQGLLDDYDALVTRGIYQSRGEALRHGLVESWRHHAGSYHTVRLDLLERGRQNPDDENDEPAGPSDESGPVHSS